MTAFAVGSTCYLIDGDLVEYVGPCGDSHIVRHVYSDEDEEPRWGRPFEVRELFVEPPVALHDEETRKAVQKLAALRSEISAASTELYEAKRDKEQALKTIGEHPDLVPLGEWLRGEITHVVVLPIYGGTIQIKTFDEAVKPINERDARSGHVRLLSLVGGKANGWDQSLHWQLSAYSDGSGSSYHHCLLATSVENAKERLQVWVDKALLRPDNDHSKLAIATSAVQLGLSVSPNWETRVTVAAEQRKANDIEQAQKHVEIYRSSLAACEAKLAALKGEQS